MSARAAVNLSELPPEARAKIEAKLGIQPELHIMRSSPADREGRAKALAGAFTKFIGEHIDLLVQVRQDFLDKDRNDSIMGCKTFTEYCTSVLHYSEGHISKLIKGKVPGASKFDGTANRKPFLAGPQIPPADLLEHNPELAGRITAGLVEVRESSRSSHPKVNGDFFRHLGHLLDAVFRGPIKDKLDVLCDIPKTQITEKMKVDAQEMIGILQDVSINAEKYIAKLQKISKAKVV
jgi:hypothetical protein